MALKNAYWEQCEPLSLLCADWTWLTLLEFMCPHCLVTVNRMLNYHLTPFTEAPTSTCNVWGCERKCVNFCSRKWRLFLTFKMKMYETASEAGLNWKNFGTSFANTNTLCSVHVKPNKTKPNILGIFSLERIWEK